jgi:hypothetical protein
MLELSFMTPAPYGDMKFDYSAKSAELTSSPNTKLVSPYEGIVVFDMTPNCKDMIKIRHEIDGETFYSIFCGVGGVLVNFGEKVGHGVTIGKFSDEKIKFYIVDNQDDIQPLPKFFNRSTYKKPETSSTTTTTTKKPKIDTNSFPNPFMDILLSPFSLASSIDKEVNKDVKKLFTKKKKDDDINEDIKQIKRLLK